MRESTNAAVIENFASETVALVGFPAHPNVGDCAIWQGQKMVLRELGVRVAYVADLVGFDARALRRALPMGTVLLHGGGNLGDVWPDHHSLRARVIEELPDYPIVQLPQTSHFLNMSARDQARSLFLEHPDLRILCRDRETLSDMLDLNGGRASLVPDSAFALGLMPRTFPATRNLWLARQDDEAISRLPATEPVDWIDARSGATRDPLYALGLRALIESEAKVQARAHRLGLEVIPNRLTARVYDRLADRRVRAGIKLLSSARVLVTDRLHAHLLALLLDLPHVLVHTGYGKITRFRDTWTAEAANVRFTTDVSRIPTLVAELENSGGGPLEADAQCELRES